ncbi:uncharacterized protein N7459_005585 [Penicillium hispanicum]|uniref:uncharacterized protein n=1 Tax=Penicillium hispanicum TaxID=1080232 RepID=UPI0025415CED|nr:uncharacterized protein N7459_005585 [Penicillium hispanicum]KAJ5579600.1 hypothetical protein N7459_005585 [Penicillium hispanicum]
MEPDSLHPEQGHQQEPTSGQIDDDYIPGTIDAKPQYTTAQIVVNDTRDDFQFANSLPNDSDDPIQHSRDPWRTPFTSWLNFKGFLTVSQEIECEESTQRTRSPHWAGSWAWETAGAVVGIICMAVLIGFLKYLDGSFYDDWKYRASPNAVASVIVTVAKAALMVPVSSCLGQLKWNHNEYHKPTPLYHMQVLEQASRGPWGALEVFWTIRPSLATLGAVLMIIAVAIDPFAQQILVYPSREVQAYNETAYVQYAHEYMPAWSTGGAADGSQSEVRLSEVEPTLQVAIMSGLSQTSSPLDPECPSGTCEYPDFVSLGVCSLCEDITQTAQQHCVVDRSANTTGPEWSSEAPRNCTYTTSSGSSITPSVIGAYARGTTSDEIITFHRQPWTSIVTSKDSVGNETSQQIISFFSVKYDQSVVYTKQNVTLPEARPTMTQCSVDWCEREYTQNHISTSRRHPTTTKSQNLISTPPADEFSFAPYSLKPVKDQKTLSKNSTYAVDYWAWTNLQSTMQSLFNTTLLQTTATGEMDYMQGIQSAVVLWNSKNLSQSMADMATSMTDNIRSSDAARHLAGRAFITRTFIHVRWPWIILPVVTVVLAVLLLVATAISSSRLHAVIWKSSVLPLLVGRLETHPDHDLGVLGSVDEMNAVSRKLKVVMASRRPPVFSESRE